MLFLHFSFAPLLFLHLPPHDFLFVLQLDSLGYFSVLTLDFHWSFAQTYDVVLSTSSLSEYSSACYPLVCLYTSRKSIASISSPYPYTKYAQSLQSSCPHPFHQFKCFGFRRRFLLLRLRRNHSHLFHLVSSSLLVVVSTLLSRTLRCYMTHFYVFYSLIHRF